MDVIINAKLTSAPLFLSLLCFFQPEEGRAVDLQVIIEAVGGLCFGARKKKQFQSLMAGGFSAAFGRFLFLKEMK